VNEKDLLSAQAFPRRTLAAALKQPFGNTSAAQKNNTHPFRNIGPSIRYSVRDPNGQAREFHHYMLPITLDGERFFLAGARTQANDTFRYLRIPADPQQGNIETWMHLRAALAAPALRIAAARRFASHATSQASLRSPLKDSALRVLNLFAGQTDNIGGFSALASFIDRSVPHAEQEKASALLLRLLEGSVWELWQITREQAGKPAIPINAKNRRFIQSSIRALSDHFLYGAPVFLQLDSFKEIKASVFQVTKTPGQKIVYLGCFFLILGIFAMFYVRERRLWFWLKDIKSHDAQTPSCVEVVMAMSSPRATIDLDQVFSHMQKNVHTILKNR
jgi:cytochrome c biogenesis protein